MVLKYFPNGELQQYVYEISAPSGITTVFPFHAEQEKIALCKCFFNIRIGGLKIRSYVKRYHSYCKAFKMEQSSRKTLVIYGNEESHLGILHAGMLSLHTSQSPTAFTKRTCVCDIGQTPYGGLHLDLIVTTEHKFSSCGPTSES